MPSNQVQSRPFAHLPFESGPLRGAWRWSRLLACFGFITLLCAAAGTRRQEPNPASAQSPLQSQAAGQPAATAPSSADDEKTENKSIETRNADPKNWVAADSAQLLKLATELKSEVDKTNTGTLSIPVVRKAGEIEKLARSVKQKVKPAIGGN